MVHWAPDLTRVLCFLCPGTAELLGELQPQAILFLGFYCPWQDAEGRMVNPQLSDCAVPQLGSAESKEPKKAVLASWARLSFSK